MGALNRVKKDQQGNMMIPHNVAGSTYEEGASVVQAVAAGVLLLGAILLVIWFKDTRMADKLINWLILIVAYLFVAQLVVRYIIINEVYLMKQTDLIQRATDKVPADLWGVINIDDDGIIYYQDGRLGLIIEAEQATVVGRDDGFRHAHYSALSDFYKVLNQGGISWTHINAMINAKQENRLARVGEDLQDCPNAAIKQMCDMHLAYLRGLEIRTLYEREYWALIARPAIGKGRLLEIAINAAENLENAAFNMYNILDKEQCYRLNVELQALSSFDANAIMIEKAQRVAGTPVAKIRELKIETGHITEHKADTIRKALKPYADKSDYIGTAEHISTLRVGEKLGNIIAQRLQYFIREKHSLNDGDLLSNIMNIKLADNNNFVQKSQNNVVDTGTDDYTVFMFGDDKLTAEEYRAAVDEDKKQVTELNQRLFSETEQAAIDARNAKRLTVEERKKATAEELKARQQAAQAAKEEEQRQIKARVKFDDFNDD